MTSCGWIWIYVGTALMLLELVVPGFVLCFFGLAAGLVGVLRFLIGDAFGLTAQLAAFSVLSVLLIVLLRRGLKRTFMGERVSGQAGLEAEYVGRLGQVTTAISEGVPGRVLIGDAEWNAIADGDIAVGARVRVISQTNLTMKVEVL